MKQQTHIYIIFALCTFGCASNKHKEVDPYAPTGWERMNRAFNPELAQQSYDQRIKNLQDREVDANGMDRCVPDERLSPVECPIIGNTRGGKKKNERIYHVSGDPHYQNMLVCNYSGIENRICFQYESEAMDQGFRKCGSGHQ